MCVWGEVGEGVGGGCGCGNPLFSKSLKYVPVNNSSPKVCHGDYPLDI